MVPIQSGVHRPVSTSEASAQRVGGHHWPAQRFSDSCMRLVFAIRRSVATQPRLVKLLGQLAATRAQHGPRQSTLSQHAVMHRVRMRCRRFSRAARAAEAEAEAEAVVRRWHPAGPAVGCKVKRAGRQQVRAVEIMAPVPTVWLWERAGASIPVACSYHAFSIMQDTYGTRAGSTNRCMLCTPQRALEGTAHSRVGGDRSTLHWPRGDADPGGTAGLPLAGPDLDVSMRLICLRRSADGSRPFTRCITRSERSAGAPVPWD